MKNFTLGLLVGAVVFVGTSVAVAESIKLPNGTPFEALQATIDELWAAIANVETTPGPQGPQGEPGPQGIQGEKGDTGERGAVGPSLHLYDATGQDLGVVLNSDRDTDGERFTVFLPQESVFTIFLTRTRDQAIFIDALDTTTYFSGLNCTGIAYAINTVGANQLIRSLQGMPINRFFRYAGTSVGPTLSKTDDRGVCVNSSLPANPNNVQLQEVTPFSLPLAWPLEIRESD